MTREVRDGLDRAAVAIEAAGKNVDAIRARFRRAAGAAVAAEAATSALFAAGIKEARRAERILREARRAAESLQGDGAG